MSKEISFPLAIATLDTSNWVRYCQNDIKVKQEEKQVQGLKNNSALLQYIGIAGPANFMAPLFN